MLKSVISMTKLSCFNYNNFSALVIIMDGSLRRLDRILRSRKLSGFILAVELAFFFIIVKGVNKTSPNFDWVENG